MKTTVDIPRNELRDAMRFTNAKTTREVILKVIVEFNRRHRMAELGSGLVGLRARARWPDR